MKKEFLNPELNTYKFDKEVACLESGGIGTGGEIEMPEPFSENESTAVMDSSSSNGVSAFN